MMKYYVLILTLFMHQIDADDQTNRITYTQRIPLYQPRYEMDNDDSGNEYTNSLIASALLGAASGLLCRQLEKRILNDFLPFRLINLIIWGAAQETFMNAITTDLHDQKIKHSPTMMKKTAWLVSWAIYLLGD